MSLYLVCLLLGQAAGELPKPIALVQTQPRRFEVKKAVPFVRLGPVIPGLRQGAVPQGLAYLRSRDWLLISFYFDGGRPSVIAAVDVKTGKLTRSLTILEPDGRPHEGHVGGLATSGDHLWIGSDRVYRVPLKVVVAAREVDYLRCEDAFTLESRSSYLTFHRNTLWVGEFVNRSTPAAVRMMHRLTNRAGGQHSAWMCGYHLLPDSPLLGAGTDTRTMPAPDYVLSVRDEVQGVTFVNDLVILSCSYGRSNSSKLAVYRTPSFDRRGSADVIANARGGAQVPVWFLDAKNHVRDQNIAPMSEGIALCRNELGILFESGAEKYQKGGKAPLDFVIFLTPKTR